MMLKRRMWMLKLIALMFKRRMWMLESRCAHGAAVVHRQGLSFKPRQ